MQANAWLTHQKGKQGNPALVKMLQAEMLAGKFEGIEFSYMLLRQMARNATTELTFSSY